MVTINAQNKYTKYKKIRKSSLIVITSFIQFTTIIYINENIAKFVIFTFVLLLFILIIPLLFYALRIFY